MIIIKSSRDISGIRKACVLAKDALAFAGFMVTPGIKTIDINDAVARFVDERGGSCASRGYRGFPKDICISVNQTVCHGIPGQYALREGDVVKIDIVTFLDGFYGDTAATFPCGRISPVAQKLIDCTLECRKIGIEQSKPGNRIGNIGYQISQYAAANGLGVVHQLGGHGVGLQLHEDPVVMHIAPKDTGPTIKPGMTFTIEPMITLGTPNVVVANDGWTANTADGKLAAQFEHTVLVVEHGCEVLT